MEADEKRLNGLATDKPAARQKYEAPKLKHLGSLREITLGSVGAVFDGGITQKTST